MAPKAPDRKDHTLNPDVEKQLNVKGSIANKRTPEAVKEELSGVEKSTLNYFREKDQGFWKRVGKYKGLIKDRARDEVAGFSTPEETFKGLSDRMVGLENYTQKRLGFFSRKTADRFAQITAEINVSSRTLSALRKQRALTADVANHFKQGNEFFRKQVLTDHGRIATAPGIRHLFGVPGDPFDKAEWMDYQKLEQAAREVQSKAREKRSQWEKAIEARFQGVRGVEKNLREIMFKHDHDPTAKDALEKEFRDCAGNGGTGCDLLNKRIDKYDIAGADPGAVKEMRNTLKKWTTLLGGKSGGRAKAFEVAGRLELTGSVSEVLTQVRALPIGTHLEVKERKNEPFNKMVLDSKKPEGYLIFKPIGDTAKLAIDLNQKTAWRYKADLVTIEQREAFKVRAAVWKEAKARGIKDSKLIHALGVAAANAMMEKDATAASVKTAVETAFGTITTGKAEILNVAETTAKPFLKEGKDKRTKAPEKKAPHALEINYDELSFSYAA